jgi:hypothetical protein
MRHLLSDPRVALGFTLLGWVASVIAIAAYAGRFVRRHYRWAREHRERSVRITFAMAFFVAGSITTTAEPFTPHGLKVIAGYVFVIFTPITAWCLLVHWAAVLSSALGRRRAPGEQS